MTAEYIYKLAMACEAFYGTRDPEEIFRQRGAKMKSSAPGGLLGVICATEGRVFVSIDGTASISARRVCAARFLAHALLHRVQLKSGRVYEEPSTVRPEGTEEREADLFAAELLIKDEEILSLLESGMSEGQIVSSFGSMREIVPRKLFSMRSRGIAAGEEVCRADFLRRCDVELFF